jgi:hypothetical protein
MGEIFLRTLEQGIEQLRGQGKRIAEPFQAILLRDTTSLIPSTNQWTAFFRIRISARSATFSPVYIDVEFARNNQYAIAQKI